MLLCVMAAWIGVICLSSDAVGALDRKITLYKPSGACWRLSNDYFILDVDDYCGVLQGLYFKNDFNNANFMGNEENQAVSVAWRDRYVKDMNHRAPMYGWTGDIFLKARLADEPEDKLTAMYTLFSDDIRKIITSDDAITCWYKGDSAYIGGFKNLEVISTYRLDRDQICWDFSIKNCASKTMVIGELGLPMVLNTSQNMGSSRTGLNHRSVKNEKYLNENRVGRHFNAAGHSSCYLAVRYGGIGDYFMMIPAGDTFIEAIGEEGDYGHDSMMLTKGSMVFLYSKSATQKPYENQATELILKPGEEKLFSFRLMRARDLQELKDKCYKNGKIDAKVVPGMLIPRDGQTKMLLRSTRKIHRIKTDPGITVEPTGSMGGRYSYRVRVSKVGQLKVRIDYGNNEWTSLMFYGTAPLEELIEARASFITKNQQVKDPEDECRYSFRSWDNDLDRMVDIDMVDGMDSIEIGGSDDRNFAPPVFLSAKNSYYPKAEEVKALDDFVEFFLYGKIQDKKTFRVKTSLFDNYQTYKILKGKPGFRSIERFLITDDQGRETTWRRWDYAWRIYNYTHVYNIYYNMYRIAKYSGLKVSRPAREYLYFAYKTAMAVYLDSTYADTLEFRSYQRHAMGNMSESHAPLGSFRLPDILDALTEEGMNQESDKLLNIIKKRSKHYVSEEYSFCCEYLIAGASTNHGAVYVYATLIDNEKLKSKIVRMILSTKGPFPRWYHYGALMNFIGSYMTSLHAVPLLKRFEETGDDRMLQLAYGSLLGHWCCVDPDGKGHNNREWRFNPVGRDDPRYGFYTNDARSLEIGVGLNCNLRFLSSMLVFDQDFGVTGYGCLATETDDSYYLKPWSGFGFRAHIVPLGIKAETINTKLKSIKISKTANRIELDLSQTVPEITEGIVKLQGLGQGSYTVSTSKWSRQYEVTDERTLTIEAVNACEQIKIVR